MSRLPTAPLLHHKARQTVCAQETCAHGVADQHSELGSRPGIQALGGTRPLGTISSWLSLVCSEWLISKQYRGVGLGLTGVPN